MPLAHTPTRPFSSAEEAWFWTIAALNASLPAPTRPTPLAML